MNNLTITESVTTFLQILIYEQPYNHWICEQHSSNTRVWVGSHTSFDVFFIWLTLWRDDRSTLFMSIHSTIWQQKKNLRLKLMHINSKTNRTLTRSLFTWGKISQLRQLCLWQNWKVYFFNHVFINKLQWVPNHSHKHWHNYYMHFLFFYYLHKVL